MKPALTYKGKPYSFEKVSSNWQRLKKVLPAEVGTIAVNFFKDSFRRQGWRDKSFSKWVERKNNKDKGRAIGVKSGRMRNATRLLKASFKQTEIINDTPYAGIFNDGFKGTVKVKSHTRNKSGRYKVTSSSLKTRRKTSRTQKLTTGSTTVKAHTRKINQEDRPFMKHSYVMELKFEKHIDNRILSAFE